MSFRLSIHQPQSIVLALVLSLTLHGHASGGETPAADSKAITTAPAEQDENWSIHGQNTDVLQGYPSFSALYSGPNSLGPDAQMKDTVSVDLMLGLRLWSGAEAHVDGLMWQGFGLSDARGVAGFPSGEAFRDGTRTPNENLARAFIRQTFGLGGEQEDAPDDPFHL